MSQHELGSLVRRLRKEHGLTQEQLAEGICSPVSISRIESGRQRPSKALLDALMDRLGLDGYQLFESSAGSAKPRAAREARNGRPSIGSARRHGTPSITLMRTGEGSC